MTAKTAIIAGQGRLPQLLGEAMSSQNVPFVLAEMDGFQADVPKGWQVEPFRVERLALLFERLQELSVKRVIFAGAVRRPAIDPTQIEPKTAMLLPRLLPAFQKGDDGLLRMVITLFEEAGFDVVGVADVAPELVPGEGVLTTHQPSEDDRADTARAAQIVQALGGLDIGQGAVVAQGLCLATEALPGTDAMLRFVAQTARRPNDAGAKGVVYKAPKPNQERRIDLPAIGPNTVEACAEAGLAGIAFEAGGVMILDRDETLAAAEDAGVFLWACAP